MKQVWVLALFLAFFAGGCSLIPPPPPRAVPPHPEKILFIGNSFTYWNMGVDEHLKTMAALSTPPLSVETRAITIGGAVLKVLWDDESALRAIREGGWDVVVLQEDIPELYRFDVETFDDYARRFDQEIRDTGAQTVLYMTWEEPRLDWIDTDGIVDAHRRVAGELGATVAPAGLAWKRAVTERPDLNLYDSDRVHPNILGTYLTVNVLFATLFDQTPVGHPYRPEAVYPDPESVEPALKERIQELRDSYRISEADAEFLQRIAWETVQEYQSEPNASQ